jgi:hypothetical protein
MRAKLHGGVAVRLIAALTTGCCAFTGLVADAAANRRHARTGHGALISVAKPGLGTHASQSSNWFGYNQGSLEQGGKLFSSISGDWTVPTARQHRAGEAEYSSTWIGIGGGCVDADCVVTDGTLIQTGTEQDVDAAGHRSYSAWWELIPAPGITIDNMTVAAGDRMHADISEAVPGSQLWTITLRNVTRRQSFTITVPYTSSHATAEWIEETPLVIDGSGALLTVLPALSKTAFNNGRTNGEPPALNAPEEIQLVDDTGHVIGTPSAPDSNHDGFALCAYATRCSAPRG